MRLRCSEPMRSPCVGLVRHCLLMQKCEAGPAMHRFSITLALRQQLVSVSADRLRGSWVRKCRRANASKLQRVSLLLFHVFQGRCGWRHGPQWKSVCSKAKTTASEVTPGMHSKASPIWASITTFMGPRLVTGEIWPCSGVLAARTGKSLCLCVCTVVGLLGTGAGLVVGLPRRWLAWYKSWPGRCLAWYRACLLAWLDWYRRAVQMAASSRGQASPCAG